MYVTVIPYLLAANLILPENPSSSNATKNIAYNYRLKMDVITEVQDKLLLVNVTGRLTCYNKNEIQLICQISNTSLESSLPQIIEKIEEQIDELKDPFQINFNENGIESLTLSTSLTAAPLIEIRIIASLFHVGVNLKDFQSFPVFEAYENTTFGLCDTKFNVMRYPLGNSVSCDKKNYSLRVVPFVQDGSKEAVEIHKTTNPEECSEVMDYFKRRNAEGPEFKVSPHESYMKITETGIFFSNTTMAMNRIRPSSDPLIPTQYSMQAIANMELESIEITENNIPTLPPSETVELTFIF